MTVGYLAHVATILAGLVALSAGCSPPLGGYKPPTLDWKMMTSDVVLHGVVRNRKTDQRFEPSGDVYSVEFQVRCIYKGAPIPENIWIDEVGYIPGHCIATNLTVGETYIVYLRKTETSGRYVQEYQQDPGDPEYIDEIVVLCETDIRYPIGLSKDYSRETCADPVDSSDCVPKPVITNPPPILRPTPPKNPVDEDDDSDSKDHQPSDPEDKVSNNVAPPYQPVKSEDKAEDDNGNTGSTTFALHMSALICLVLSVRLLQYF